ncbi:MAG: cation:proton antiporter, partial [Oscillospiraceae bacterium]
GPVGFNILQQTDFLSQVAELGVIIIMFSAGLGTDLKELKKTGKSGFIVATMGVIVPLIGGAALAACFNHGQYTANGSILLQNIFIGVILTATSVSITVETLKEIGKLSTKVGNTILAAALIDDVLGLIALTIVTSLAGAKVNVGIVLLKIVLFFVFVFVVGVVVIKLMTFYINKKDGKNLHRFPLLAVVLCLVMAYAAEQFFGVADIIGAFAAGVIVAATPKGQYVSSKVNPLSYLLLSPIFFACIGIKVKLPAMTFSIILFAVLLVAVAILAKLIGCGAGAKMCGEVALIVANRGMAMGIMPQEFFGPVVIMVVCAAVFTPILLKLVFKEKTIAYDDLEQSNLVDRYEEAEQLDIVASNLLENQENMRKK